MKKIILNDFFFHNVNKEGKDRVQYKFEMVFAVTTEVQLVDNNK